MSFATALVDLIRRTIKAYVKDTVFFYKAKIASKPAGGNVYTLDDNSLATVLNGGEYAAGDEVLVIKTDGGKKFIYYWNPAVSHPDAEAIAALYQALLYYTTSSLRYALLTPDAVLTSGADYPVMSASMTPPASLPNLTIYRKPSATEFNSFVGYVVPAAFDTWNSEHVTLNISATEISSSFRLSQNNNQAYGGSGTASMSALTSINYSGTLYVLPTTVSRTAFIFLNNSGTTAVITQTAPLRVMGASGGYMGASGLDITVSDSDYLACPALHNAISFSCYELVSGAKYAIGEYTSGSTLGGFVFLQTVAGDKHIYTFLRSATGDTNYLITPSGFLISPSYVRRLDNVEAAPIPAGSIVEMARKDDTSYWIPANTTGSATAYAADPVANGKTTFYVLPDRSAYQGYEVSTFINQVRRFSTITKRPILYLGTSSGLTIYYSSTEFVYQQPYIVGTVHCIAVASNGDVYVGGDFGYDINGNPFSNIAKWDGATLTPLGAGTNGIVYALLIANGVLYAAGSFTTAGGLSSPGFAMWSAGAWHTIPDMPANDGGDLSTLAAGLGGLIYVGGYRSTSHPVLGDVYPVYRWDGASWTTVGIGADYAISTLAVDSAETIYAGGAFDHMDGIALPNIARYIFGAWTDVGGGVDFPVCALAAGPGTAIYVSGNFLWVGGGTLISKQFAIWDGATWHATQHNFGTVGPRVMSVGADGFIYFTNYSAAAYFSPVTWVGHSLIPDGNIPWTISANTSS